MNLLEKLGGWLGLARPHANGHAPKPDCRPLPTRTVISGLRILGETTTTTLVCTNLATGADAALALAKLRQPPPGWCWAADAQPGRRPGHDCLTRPGWRHVEFNVTPLKPREEYRP